MINKTGLTLNGLTVIDYLANPDVHLTGGTDAEEEKDSNKNDEEDAADNDDDEILGRLMRREYYS